MQRQKLAAEAHLQKALDVLHGIGGAYQSRRSLLKNTLTAPLRASLEKKALTDKQIEDLALDTWESIVLVVNKDPSITTWEDAWGEAVRAVAFADAKIQDLAGWSGSSGNWALQDCSSKISKAKEILESKPAWQEEEKK